MENLQSSSERNIMPPDLFKHYIDSRAKARFSTGETTYIPDSTLSGFKCFTWQNPDLPYHFEDRFADSSKRPSDFGGYEINRENSDKGEMLTFYSYNGGLTEEGLKVGESEVYDRILQRFLEEHVEEIRFGKKVRFTIEENDDVWVYEGDGEIQTWSWKDKETIRRNGILFYELNGSGVCFIKGF